ncbi:MAG: hypothetical protein QM796_02980 [Chthoniobacteraceae bacterium]
MNELRVKVATERQRHQSLQHQRQPMEARLDELHEIIDAAPSRHRELPEPLGHAAGKFAEHRGQLRAPRGQPRRGRAGSGLTLSGALANRWLAWKPWKAALREVRQMLSQCIEQRGQWK